MSKDEKMDYSEVILKRRKEIKKQIFWSVITLIFMLGLISFSIWVIYTAITAAHSGDYAKGGYFLMIALIIDVAIGNSRLREIKKKLGIK